jgi:hypothetical protein
MCGATAVPPWPRRVAGIGQSGRREMVPRNRHWSPGKSSTTSCRHMLAIGAARAEADGGAI